MKKVPVLDVGVEEKEDQSPGKDGEKKDKEGFPFWKMTERGPYGSQRKQGDEGLP